MAGATNRAFKAAGIPKSAIKELRVTGGRGLTLRSAISLAGERGIQIPQKAHDFLAKRDAKSAQKAKPADDGAERQRRDAARAEARNVYERGNAGAREGLAGLRSDIRQRVQDVRDAEGTLKGAYNHAYSAAEQSTPAFKRGKEGIRREVMRSKASRDATVQRAAMQAKQARIRLQAALASRDATARARKQQRGAESGGQMDLFSGAPKPRAASPFERRLALRDAKVAKVSRNIAAVGTIIRAKRREAAANAPAASPRLVRSLDGLTRAVAANRKSALAARDARRAEIAANPRQRGEADYRRVLQKASASANEAYNIAKARPTTENERRSSRRQDRLMRVVNMSIGKVDTKGLNKNPYERPAQESVAKYDRREKARERAKREKQAAADAARRSNDFWYR